MPKWQGVVGNLGVPRDQVAAVAKLIISMPEENTISCVEGVCVCVCVCVCVYVCMWSVCVWYAIMMINAAQE